MWIIVIIIIIIIIILYWPRGDAYGWEEWWKVMGAYCRIYAAQCLMQESGQAIHSTYDYGLPLPIIIIIIIAVIIKLVESQMWSYRGIGGSVSQAGRCQLLQKCLQMSARVIFTATQPKHPRVLVNCSRYRCVIQQLAFSRTSLGDSL